VTRTGREGATAEMAATAMVAGVADVTVEASRQTTMATTARSASPDGMETPEPAPGVTMAAGLAIPDPVATRIGTRSGPVAGIDDPVTGARRTVDDPNDLQGRELPASRRSGSIARLHWQPFPMTSSRWLAKC